MSTAAARFGSIHPSSHKTEHHGKERRIYIGPRAQEILRPHLDGPQNRYCFEPRRKRSGKRYTTDSYRRVIHRACEKRWQSLKAAWERDNPGKEFKDKLVRWSPNQLRHTAGTAIRDEFDAETSQSILGHSNISMTEIYAEKSKRRAIEAAQRLG